LGTAAILEVRAKHLRGPEQSHPIHRLDGSPRHFFRLLRTAAIRIGIDVQHQGPGFFGASFQLINKISVTLAPIAAVIGFLGSKLANS
jgi:hypothetical protein